jgi:hypothetical protein
MNQAPICRAANHDRVSAKRQCFESDLLTRSTFPKKLFDQFDTLPECDTILDVIRRFFCFRVEPGTCHIAFT